MSPSLVAPEAGLTRLTDLLRHGGPMAVITGAGLSTASGIPAYRDQHGQWQHSRPIQHQEFLRSETVQRRYWARSFVGWPTIGRAEPNAGHHALARLERAGRVHTVITQNVDGLHQRAGSQRVIELHGRIGQVVCLSCRQTYPRHEVQDWLTRINPDVDPAMAAMARTAPDGDAHLEDAAHAGFRVPACPACRGPLKPDVVFFGDNVPRDRVAEATRVMDDASALLVVGSTLMVYSGFRFASQAHRLGKPIIAINRGVTRADDLLTAKIDDDCSTVLTRLLDAL
ncbi:MAG TPA: NAD-dependent protein deacetylase [Aquabacterium sp.]|uniref:NAD-dependent protein deacetylase n=1 Tax=Aquabacterium sp. TaxID=1872578 RepID=UPI002E32B4A2|nr:NAD-dependent protein deacetylase [Aquabacterium sp.]HEX5371720.1 NAD-dependent protein deacetylase [Aquabacterium sp.]